MVCILFDSSATATAETLGALQAGSRMETSSIPAALEGRSSSRLERSSGACLRTVGEVCTICWFVSLARRHQEGRIRSMFDEDLKKRIEIGVLMLFVLCSFHVNSCCV